MNDDNSVEPDFSSAGPVRYKPANLNSPELAVQKASTAETELLSIPGVVSVGVGSTPLGEAALIVGVTDAAVQKRLPSEIRGVSVLVAVLGQVDALRSC